ncbi:anti-sigma factor [Streptomyces chryseus]
MVLAACVAAATAFGGTAAWQFQGAQQAEQRVQQARQETADMARVLAASDARTVSASVKGGARATVIVSRSQDTAVFLASGLPEHAPAHHHAPGTHDTPRLMHRRCRASSSHGGAIAPCFDTSPRISLTALSCALGVKWPPSPGCRPHSWRGIGKTTQDAEPGCVTVARRSSSRDSPCTDGGPHWASGPEGRLEQRSCTPC